MSVAQASPTREASAIGREGRHVAEMQRRRLLLAITEVVGGQGLEAASVGRVCERAGVSRRTFYELFEDREACLLAAFEQAVERLARHAREARPDAGRWSERLRTMLAAVLELLDAEPHTARMCVVETLRAGPAVLERRRIVVERLARIVDEGRGASRTGKQAPPLTAQGVVGGALSVVHAQLLATAPEQPAGLAALTGPLMATIVHPYLGAVATRRELERPAPSVKPAPAQPGADPFKDLPIRFTYRTARVLATIASDPGASNRLVAHSSGVTDEGQMSRLLRRLESCELIENRGSARGRGEPNAWSLTARGRAVQAVIAAQGAVA